VAAVQVSQVEGKEGAGLIKKFQNVQNRKKNSTHGSRKTLRFEYKGGGYS